MPKKKVGKVKKAKAGKGKKEGRQESRADRESDLEKAKANAALWELRVKVKDQSLAQYREDCRKLARAKEELTNQLSRAEKDNIDLIGYMRKQDAGKEEQINILQKRLQNQEAMAREEQNKLKAMMKSQKFSQVIVPPKLLQISAEHKAVIDVENYTQQINELQELFKKRSGDFNMIQDGMRKIKEFQKKKAQMEKELSNIKGRMAAVDKKHRENLNEMECNFFNEKARLEKEAEQKINVIMEKAYNQAVQQLDDASRSVYMENVRLNEALKYHTKESEDLQKLANSLAQENTSLAMDKDTFALMVKKNTAEMEAQKEELTKLRSTVASLEQALVLKAEEPVWQQDESKALVSLQESQVELEKLQKVLATRERELAHVKQLARTVVQQRSELEQFFHEVLVQVKQEIEASRLRYKKEALQAYQRRLREATAGKVKFPPIRTFHKTPHSTNSVHSDMEAAARCTSETSVHAVVTEPKQTHQPGSKVEISDLTWEQKEQVLRLLFAKINGQRERKNSQHLPLSGKKNFIDSDAAGIIEDSSPATFITQAPEPALPSNPGLPNIHST